MDWSAEYELGRETLDRAHRDLARALTSLSRAVAGRSSVATTNETLADLFQVWLEHCRVEHEEMERHGYPAMAEHAAEHLELTKLLAEVIFEYGVGGKSERVEGLPEYLRRWFTSHLEGLDRALAEFIQDRSPQAT